MSAGCAGNFEASGDRDTLVEPDDLQRDLSLIMEHGHNAVEIAPEGLHEQRV